MKNDVRPIRNLVSYNYCKLSIALCFFPIFGERKESFSLVSRRERIKDIEKQDPYNQTPWQPQILSFLPLGLQVIPMATLPGR